MPAATNRHQGAEFKWTCEQEDMSELIRRYVHGANRCKLPKIVVLSTATTRAYSISFIVRVYAGYSTLRVAGFRSSSQRCP